MKNFEKIIESLEKINQELKQLNEKMKINDDYVNDMNYNNNMQKHQQSFLDMSELNWGEK